jgi:hypothetical protein
MAKPDKPPPVEEIPPDQIAPEVPNVEEEIPPILLVQPPHVPGTPVVRLCPNAITCPGSDSPFQNFSSESPDGLDFLSIQFAYGDDWGAPPLQTQYELLSCGIVLSRSTTPFDAALQALANAISCAGPQKTVFNNPKVCKVPGPNGSFRYYTIPGGTIVAANQLTADQQAAALACHFAAQNPLQLTQTLANGCNNQAYAAQIRASGGTAPYIFMIQSGFLPAGLIFEQNDVASALISGTPTQAGNFPFTVLISDSNGLQFAQTYALVVMDIANAELLPGPNQGSSYFAHLIPVGGFPPYTFVLDHFSPPLPPGIHMDTSGEFTGVPSTFNPISILVDMIDSLGNICLIQVKSLGIPWDQLNWGTFEFLNASGIPPGSAAPLMGKTCTVTASTILGTFSFTQADNGPQNGLVNNPSPGLVNCVLDTSFVVTNIGPFNDGYNVTLLDQNNNAFLNTSLSVGASGSNSVPFTVPAGTTQITVQVAMTVNFSANPAIVNTLAVTFSFRNA